MPHPRSNLDDDIFANRWRFNCFLELGTAAEERKLFYLVGQHQIPNQGKQQQSHKDDAIHLTNSGFEKKRYPASNKQQRSNDGRCLCHLVEAIKKCLQLRLLHSVTLAFWSQRIKGFDLDVQRGSFAHYITNNSEAGCKVAGKFRLEGKDYVVDDGDVMHFRFNT